MQNIFIGAIFFLYLIPFVLTTQKVGDGGQTNSESTSQMEPETSDAPVIPPETRKYQPLERDNAWYCPPEDRNRLILEKFKTTANIMKTLIKKNFSKNQKKLCLYEIEPVLDYRIEDGKIKTWWKNDHHQMFFFGFQLWKYELPPPVFYDSVRNMDPLPYLEAEFSAIYDIIYDTSIERVIFTRHKITSSIDNGSEDLEKQVANIQDEISTEPFSFDDEYFSNMDEAFKKYNYNPNNGQMFKQMLVPKQDMSSIRRKSATHYINIASLWENLKSLMDIINNTIRIADNQIKRKHPFIANPTEKITQHELTIHTRLFYPTLGPFEWVNIKYHNGLRIPKVWGKFIHYRAQKYGVLIFIHNTPGKVPQEKEKYCEADQRVQCNFSDWIDGNNIDVEQQQYAYCCQASEEALGKNFLVGADVRDVLHLGKISRGDI